MASYARTKAGANLGQLHAELVTALGSPPFDYITSDVVGSANFNVNTTVDLSAGQITTMDNTITAHVPVTYASGAGTLIASAAVLTGQANTLNNVWQDLTTVCQVQFNLATASIMFVSVSAQCQNGTAAGINSLSATADGTTNGLIGVHTPTANYLVTLAGMGRLSLAAGSHTIKLQVHVNAGVATFSYRALAVWITS